MSNGAHQQAQSPAQSSAEFPVRWEQPDDELFFWDQERAHFPEPILMLDDAFIRLLYHQGFNGAAAAYELPIRARARRINTYHYMTMAPSVPPEEMEAQGKRAEAKLGAAMARLGELWEQEWRPEIEQHLAFWRGFELRSASVPDLIEHYDETLRRLARAWEIHFLAAMPFLLSTSLYDEMFRELFAGSTTLDALKLLQGFDNKSLETDRALWQLSRRALAKPNVRQVLEERAAAEVIPALEESAEGRAFLTELRAFLDRYGHRFDKNVLSGPSWIEDPTTVLKNLRDYVGQPDRDPHTAIAALAAERERLVADARDRLQGYPRPVVEQLEFLLNAAQTGHWLSEEHAYWIDYACSDEARMVFGELGRRLAAASVLESATDVFHLTFAELRETLTALPNLDRRSLVAERKAEIERFQAVEAPLHLGTPPSGPPPSDPLGLAIGKFFGGPPPQGGDEHELRGNPGSPGVARGPAKVVHSLTEAGKLQPGDVLVTEATSPPWTPLFATAAAIVTDAGGVLSHCAVVAREYRIPAVVGTGRGTSTIQDGQMLEVDGGAGVVRIVGGGGG